MIPSPTPDDFAVDLEATYELMCGPLPDDEWVRLSAVFIHLAAHYKRLAVLHVTAAVLDGAEPCEKCKGVGKEFMPRIIKVHGGFESTKDCPTCGGTGAKQ